MSEAIGSVIQSIDQIFRPIGCQGYLYVAIRLPTATIKILAVLPQACRSLSSSQAQPHRISYCGGMKWTRLILRPPGQLLLHFRNATHSIACRKKVGKGGIIIMNTYKNRKRDINFIWSVLWSPPEEYAGRTTAYRRAWPLATATASALRRRCPIQCSVLQFCSLPFPQPSYTTVVHFDGNHPIPLQYHLLVRCSPFRLPSGTCNYSSVTKWEY